MNERSATTISGRYGRSSGRRSRTFVRSSTVTRSSVRNDQASCPYPTSTATTCAAPRRRRQSVNPPVEAPASRPCRAATSTSKRSNAASSFPPARDTNLRGGPTSSTGVLGSTSVEGLLAARPETMTRPSRTATCACVRVATRPRRTSSASSRRRATTTGVRPARSGGRRSESRPRAWPSTAWPSTACAWTSCPVRAPARERACAVHPPRPGTRRRSSSAAT